MSTDSTFLVFIGILISDIVYQSGLLTKIYKEITKIEQRIDRLEQK